MGPNKSMTIALALTLTMPKPCQLLYYPSPVETCRPWLPARGQGGGKEVVGGPATVSPLQSVGAPLIPFLHLGGGTRMSSGEGTIEAQMVLGVLGPLRVQGYCGCW